MPHILSYSCYSGATWHTQNSENHDSVKYNYFLIIFYRIVHLGSTLAAAQAGKLTDAQPRAAYLNVLPPLACPRHEKSGCPNQEQLLLRGIASRYRPNR